MKFLPVLAVVVGLVRSRTQLSLTSCTTLLSHHLELTITAIKTSAAGINQPRSLKIIRFVTVPAYDFPLVVKSTPPSWLNNIRGGNVRPSVGTSVRPSTKSLSDFNEIWYVHRGRWVMHDGMPYDPIQGQGHGASEVPKIALFKVYLLRHLQRELANDH